jgi:hypothetical protein
MLTVANRVAVAAVDLTLNIKPMNLSGLYRFL